VHARADREGLKARAKPVNPVAIAGNGDATGEDRARRNAVVAESGVLRKLARRRFSGFFRDFRSLVAAAVFYAIIDALRSIATYAMTDTLRPIAAPPREVK
jgi:hypothetical protein